MIPQGDEPERALAERHPAGNSSSVLVVARALVWVLIALVASATAVLCTMEFLRPAEMTPPIASPAPSPPIGPFESDPMAWHGQNDRFDLRVHLASKTQYFPQAAARDLSEPPPGYTPLQVVLLARHGERSATASHIAAFEKLELKIQSAAIQGALRDGMEWLAEWRSPFGKGDDGELLEVGAESAYFLAKRIAARHPRLQHVRYTPRDYVVEHTQVFRAGMTASAFMQGLLEGRGSDAMASLQPFYVTTNPKKMDSILRPYDTCDAFQEWKRSDAALEQAFMFREPSLQSIADIVTENTFSSEAFAWTIAELKELYESCAYEVLLFNRSDTTCSLFSPDHILDLEFEQDLQKFYEYSYGNDLSYRMMVDLWRRVRDVSLNPVLANEPAPVLMASFAHAETVIPFVSLLGLFRDSKPLLANATREERDTRQFVTSIISPFLANVVLEVYRNDELHDAPPLVRVLVNEKEHVMGGCSEVFCPLSTLVEVMDSRTRDLEFCEICAGDEGGQRNERCNDVKTVAKGICHHDDHSPEPFAHVDTATRFTY